MHFGVLLQKYIESYKLMKFILMLLAMIMLRLRLKKMRMSWFTGQRQEVFVLRLLRPEKVLLLSFRESLCIA